MPEPLTTIEQVQHHLCARAAELHKAISARPKRYSNPEPLALTNQLVGVRQLLDELHGGHSDPTKPSTDVGAVVLVDWWKQHHPADWEGENAAHRHGEQLYLAMHRLMLNSGCNTVQELARRTQSPKSSAYLVMSHPAGCIWSTLEVYVNEFGGDRDELLALWERTPRGRRGRPRATQAKDLPPDGA